MPERLSSEPNSIDVFTAEIDKAEEAIDRYLTAFEAGTLPETRCGERVRNLGARIAELRQRQAVLSAAFGEAQVPMPTEADLEIIRERTRAALDGGGLPKRKALLGELVAEVRVQDRSSIVPWFRVFSAIGTPEPVATEVRTLAGVAGERGFEPLIG